MIVDDPSFDNLCSNTCVKYFLTVFATPSDDGQQWPKHVKANFHILLLNMLQLMNLTIRYILKGSDVDVCIIFRITGVSDFVHRPVF
jgi:hypothetical protein